MKKSILITLIILANILSYSQNCTQVSYDLKLNKKNNYSAVLISCNSYSLFQINFSKKEMAKSWIKIDSSDSIYLSQHDYFQLINLKQKVNLTIGAYKNSNYTVIDRVKKNMSRRVAAGKTHLGRRYAIKYDLDDSIKFGPLGLHNPAGVITEMKSISDDYIYLRLKHKKKIKKVGWTVLENYIYDLNKPIIKKKEYKEKVRKDQRKDLKYAKSLKKTSQWLVQGNFPLIFESIDQSIYLKHNKKLNKELDRLHQLIKKEQ